MGSENLLLNISTEENKSPIEINLKVFKITTLIWFPFPRILVIYY